MSAPRSRSSRLALAFGFGEEAFAQADGVGGDFDEFVFGDVFQRDFECEFARGLQEDVLIAAGGAHVGKFLFAADVDG